MSEEIVTPKKRGPGRPKAPVKYFERTSIVHFRADNTFIERLMDVFHKQKTHIEKNRKAAYFMTEFIQGILESKFEEVLAAIPKDE